MPFPDGWKPDDERDRGGADEEFASVVFDEAFVQAAEIHEPSAVERLLAAAEARAEAQEAEARRARTRGSGVDDDLYDDGYGPGPHGGFAHGPDDDDLYDPDDDDRLRTGAYASSVRWRRPVAWALAVLMGVGMVALAFSAVYRGASSSGRQEQVPPPATTELEKGFPAAPSAPADHSRPPVAATPRTR
ncbi:hypothetical protein [Streptomyces sp. NPDC046821]|uniref:SCO2584 family spore wall biosynthesis protein n=1 Tax=Streptomyces sp. NPDC046821 TaxID=3154702 RepID=UPI0034109E7C